VHFVCIIFFSEEHFHKLIIGLIKTINPLVKTGIGLRKKFEIFPFSEGKLEKMFTISGQIILDAHSNILTFIEYI